MNRKRSCALIQKALPHIVLILSAMLTVLLIVNYYNPLMHFLDNTMTHFLLGALCLCAAVMSVMSIYKNSKK